MPEESADMVKNYYERELINIRGMDIKWGSVAHACRDRMSMATG